MTRARPAEALAHTALTAGGAMQVRAMLSSISFVYTHYYELSTTVGGVLISVPPLTGLLASLLVARIAAKTSPARLVAAGMVAGGVPPTFLLLSAGLPGCVDCLYARPRWYMTTIPCALISGVGFFALPAMQARSRPDLGQISARSRPDLGQISASCRGSPSLEFDAAQERRGERRDAEIGEDDDGEGCGDDCLVRDMVRLTPLSLPPPSALQV